jgi:hypothetical protein
MWLKVLDAHLDAEVLKGTDVGVDDAVPGVDQREVEVEADGQGSSHGCDPNNGRWPHLMDGGLP